ncbi:MAG TPA: DUF63 family protein [Candidatus Thermoplasmatota archaeon]|nr:DUF63 family protein [Candidatus Thermoplasmatota archaeon]
MADPESAEATAASDDAPAPAPQPPETPGAARERLAEFYARNKSALWTAAILGPMLVVLVGNFVAPQIFWDQFLWKELWGSAVADASGQGRACWDTVQRQVAFAVPAGRSPAEFVCVREDYSLASELIYGAITALALLGIYVHLVKRFSVEVDARFIGALLPFILFGPAVRTLEDTDAFGRPYSYFTISPFLYLQIAVYVVLFILLGVTLARRRDLPWLTRTAAFAAVLFAFVAVATLAYAADPQNITRAAHPAYFALGALVGTAGFGYAAREGRDGVNASLLFAGLAFLVPALAMIGVWLSGNPWPSVFTGAPSIKWACPTLGTDPGACLFTHAVPWVLGIAAAVTGAVLLVSRVASAKIPALAAYGVPVNLALVLGHQIDGWATLVAIHDPFGLGFDALGYGEKHVVSDFFLQMGGGFGFPIIKLLVVLAIVYFLDVAYKDDLKQDRNLVGLVKMAILVVGLAPGLRNLFRMTMAT